MQVQLFNFHLHVSAVDEEEHSHAVCPWRWRRASRSPTESRLSSERRTLWTVNCYEYRLVLFNHGFVKFLYLELKNVTS